MATKAAECIVAFDQEATDPLVYVPYFYSRIFDLHWVMYGCVATEARPMNLRGVGGKPGKVFGVWWLAKREKAGEGGSYIAGGFLEGGTPELNKQVEAAVANKTLWERGMSLRLAAGES